MGPQTFPKFFIEPKIPVPTPVYDGLIRVAKRATHEGRINACDIPKSKETPNMEVSSGTIGRALRAPEAK